MTDETIFAAVLDQPDPVARAAFLAAACAGDTQRRRVEGLLAAHDGAATAVETPATAPHHPDAAVGDVVGEDGHFHSGAADVLECRPDELGRVGRVIHLEVVTATLGA